MKKKLVVLLIVSLVFGFNLARAEVGQPTINYLLAHQTGHWVTQALRAAGQDELDLSYLDDFDGETAISYTGPILAIVAAGQNPYSFNEQNWVESLLSYYNNNQLGSTGTVNDDFWGILALRSAGVEVNDEVIQNCKTFILNHQNEDNGWSFSTNGNSDTNDTAAAIMALLEAGQLSDSQEIQNALAYLREMQNEDGGFPYTADGESDGNSDAWVISALNKLEIDPISWQQGENTPASHLESLILEDGSYRWQAGDREGNILTTAQAAVALSNSFYPVAYFESPAETNLHHLRIEGQNQTICDAEVEGTTAMNIVENGAEACDYTYHISQTDWGPYLDRINNEQAQGELGWLYRVNWISAMVGAADYQLEEDDYVLWAYGNWAIQPLRIHLSANQAEFNQEVIATVEYFNNENWLPASEATVMVGERTFQTNGNGQATFSASERSTLRIYAEKENFIRSQKEMLVVGSGPQETVSLRVNVENEGGGGGGGDALSFTIDTHDLDFGTLRPGAQAERGVRIINTGDVPAYFESIVSGDVLFEDNIYLDNEFWENFNAVIQNNNADDIPVVLRVPQNYGGSGAKEGSLIFWAARQ